jgi:hypothetical protein
MKPDVDLGGDRGTIATGVKRGHYGIPSQKTDEAYDTGDPGAPVGETPTAALRFRSALQWLGLQLNLPPPIPLRLRRRRQIFRPGPGNLADLGCPDGQLLEIGWPRLRHSGVRAAYCVAARYTARRVGRPFPATRVTLVPPDPQPDPTKGGTPHYLPLENR